MTGCPGRFDPSPLLRHLELAASGPGDDGLAATAGVSRRTIQRWRHGSQRLRIADADRIASRLGLHPTALWDDWYARSRPASASMVTKVIRIGPAQLAKLDALAAGAGMSRSAMVRMLVDEADETTR